MGEGGCVCVYRAGVGNSLGFEGHIRNKLGIGGHYMFIETDLKVVYVYFLDV